MTPQQPRFHDRQQGLSQGLAMPGHRPDELFATPDFGPEFGPEPSYTPEPRRAAPRRVVRRSMTARLAMAPATLARALAVAMLAIGGVVVLGEALGFGQGSTAAAATFGGVAVQDENGVAIEPMPFERQGDSFPGSAFYYLDSMADPAAPSGDLAADAHWDNDDTGGEGLLGPGPAAKALRQAGSEIDRTRALTCLTTAIYYEAASEPDAGQRAVAQVVLNRVAHPAWPKTVCGVVYQGSERTTGCQFSFTCDGALARKPVKMFWDRAEAVARAAMGGYVYSPVGLATHYHTFAVHPYWAPSLRFLGQIGAHRFYSLAGPAGAPAAFHLTYSGGEPMAAPNPRSATAAASAGNSSDPLAIERAYEASLRAAHGNAQQIGLINVSGRAAPLAPAPAYTGEALQRGGDAAFRARALPAGNNVMPEYQASGTWIANPE